MIPIHFKEENCIYAKDQPEYQPLPAHRDEAGIVVTCWQLTTEEKKVIAETGVIYISLLTFNLPLQPLSVTVENPL